MTIFGSLAGMASCGKVKLSCNLVPLPQNTCFILFFRRFSS